MSKLSLLLKVLEDENKDALEQQQKLIQERVLPYLGDNIRCGNSLIATDILKDETLTLEEIANINPYDDWEEEYPAIFEDGGFDAVIGNPPYFNIQTLGAKSKQVEYIKEKYEIWMDKSDILFYFIAKSIQISKHYVSFIISNAFLFSNKGKKLRNYILNNAPISDIVNFENFMVFKAGITTAIATFDKNKENTIANAITLKEKNYSSKQITDNIDNDKNWFSVNLQENEEFAL